MINLALFFLTLTAWSPLGEGFQEIFVNGPNTAFGSQIARRIVLESAGVGRWFWRCQLGWACGVQAAGSTGLRGDGRRQEQVQKQHPQCPQGA